MDRRNRTAVPCFSWQNQAGRLLCSVLLRRRLTVRLFWHVTPCLWVSIFVFFEGYFTFIFERKIKLPCQQPPPPPTHTPSMHTHTHARMRTHTRTHRSAPRNTTITSIIIQECRNETSLLRIQLTWLLQRPYSIFT
jgi:hypothetical protein